MTGRWPADIARRVLRHPGRWADDVAAREHLPLETVRGVRMEAGRNAGDGLRRLTASVCATSSGSARARTRDTVDFDELMRSNVSVCQ